MPSIHSRLVECKKYIKRSVEQILQYNKAANAIHQGLLEELLKKLKTQDVDAWLDRCDVTINIVTECKILLRREQQRRQLANNLHRAISKGKLKREKMAKELADESDYNNSDDSNNQGPMVVDV